MPKRSYSPVREVVIKKPSVASASVASDAGTQPGPSAVVTTPTPVAPAGASPSLSLRMMNIDDASFVIDSFCNSYRHSRDMKSMDPALFKIEMRNFIRDFIPGKRVLVASLEESPRSILGWCIAEPPRENGGLWIIHYVLVKPEFQGQGVATALLAPFREASPQAMLWATMETDALRFFGKGFLIVNKFLLYKTGPMQPVATSGIRLGHG